MARLCENQQPGKDSHGCGRYVKVGKERDQLGEPMAQKLQTALAEGEASRTSSHAIEPSLQVFRNYPERVCPREGFSGILEMKRHKRGGEKEKVPLVYLVLSASLYRIFRITW